MRAYLYRYKRLLFNSSLLWLLSMDAAGQSISGNITDENNEPIPFAHVFINELKNGTSANAEGKFFLTVNPGIYNLVVSSIGFQSISIQVIISDKPLVKNFTLHSSAVQLNEIVIKSKRKDPA